MSNIKKGPGVVRVLKALTTKEDLIDLLGYEASGKELFDMSWWDSTHTTTGYLNLKLAVQDVKDDNIHVWNLFLKNEGVRSKSGKTIFIDDYGKSSSYAFTFEELPPFQKDVLVNPRVAREGEVTLTNILQGICHYTPENEDKTWSEQMYFKGLSFDTILDGNFKGLNIFLEYFADRGGIIGVIFSELNNRQNIETDPNTIFWVMDEDVPPHIFERISKFRQGFNPLRGKID